MAKIYLAARYDRLFEMQQIAGVLSMDGHSITAQWVYGNEEGKTLEDIAIMDRNDVSRADTVIQFTDPRGTLATGGGRHTEFGLGYAWGKRMILVGEREQIFHNLPGVEQVNDLFSLRQLIKIVPKYEEMTAYSEVY
jgi:hypothetical protein